MSDPLSETIQHAVDRAIEARLPDIVEAIKSAQPTYQPDSFVKISAVAERLGMSPSSIWRLEREGKLPPRERLGGSIGYRESTLRNLLENLDSEKIPAPATAIKKGEKRGRRVAK